jgi:hypothetical protein
MLREEVTEAEVADGAPISEDITAEDIMAEDIMADAIMAVADVFILEDTGGPASIIGDGHITTPIIGDGHIPIPTIPILFLQLLLQNRNNSNLIIGISVRTHRVTTPTSKIVRAVG